MVMTIFRVGSQNLTTYRHATFQLLLAAEMPKLRRVHTASTSSSFALTSAIAAVPRVLTRRRQMLAGRLSTSPEPDKEGFCRGTNQGNRAAGRYLA